MKKVLFAGLALALLAQVGAAQDYSLNKAWEYLATDNSEEYPWLRAEMGTNWEHDGTNTMDFFSGLIRYDESRLMLFLEENGVDEANATEDELAIAAEFPDRSFLWIRPSDGTCLGVALTIPVHPVEDSEFYIQKCSGTHADGPTSVWTERLTEQWVHFDADDDGYLYVADKHKMLRYTPDGNGGFTGPEVVFTYPEMDPPYWTADEESLHYRAWCMHSVNVKGSGDNKIMTTAARHWIDGGGIIYYTSEDGGASWTMQTHRGQEQRGGIGTGGAASQPIVDEEYGEEWVFGTGFPGSDRRLYRFVRTSGTTEEFLQDDDLWSPTGDETEGVEDVDKYVMWEMTDVAAADGVPYVAVLTLPKWQSRNPDENNPTFVNATAWVALHSVTLDPNEDVIEGDFISSYQIDWREGDEPQGVAGDEDNWDAAYFATINMNVPDGFPEGTAEILWSGGVGGFGRLVVGEAPTAANDWAVY